MAAHRLRLAALGSAAACIAAPAAAQVTPPSPPSQTDISRTRVGLPPPEAPQFDLRIQSPERAAVPRAVDAVTFTLKRVVVEGNTAISQAEAQAFFASVLDRPIGLEDVRVAAAGLEALYRARGYFLTRVFIPPQRLTDGTLTVRVVEGRLDAIDVQGLDEGSRRMVREMLAPLLEKTPIDLPSLERRLLILNDLPGIAASGVLRPGATLGASTLVVTLTKPGDTLLAGVSNTNSDLLGPWVYSASATLGRPLGLPGAFNVSAGASGPGFAASQSISARYSAGIGHSGLIASVGAIYAEAHPKGALRPLEIGNTLASISARARYPLLRSRAQSLFVEGGLSVSRARTDVLGVRLIEDNTSVADIGVIYQQAGWLGGTTVASASIFQALPIFGASDADALRPSVLGFDPGFTRFTYGVQRIQRLGRAVSALVAVQGQYTSSKLLSGELIAFGGPGIGRGYDPSQITGDRGIGGFAELRWDISVDRPWLASAQPYAFIDAARATSIASDFGPESSQHLSSGGVGVRFFQRYGALDLQFAHAFRRFENGAGRGDNRVLLSLTLNN